MTQVKFWCWTSYKSLDDIPDVTSFPAFKYCVYQQERCPETGRDHIQGYIEFTRSVRMDTVKTRFEDRSLHLEPRRGTAQQAREYCMKEESRIAGPFEFGTWNPQTPGKRNDLNEVKQKLKDGASMKRIAEEHFQEWCKYENAFKKYKKMIEEKPVIHTQFNVPKQDLSKPLVILGPTGCGKTHYALSHFQNPLQVSHIDDLQQLDSDHDGIVFDDMRFDHWPPETVIHLLDIELTRSIHNRYLNARIPAGMKRIFTHNSQTAEGIFFKADILDSQKAAIMRRINVYRVSDKLF